MVLGQAAVAPICQGRRSHTEARRRQVPMPFHALVGLLRIVAATIGCGLARASTPVLPRAARATPPSAQPSSTTIFRTGRLLAPSIPGRPASGGRMVRAKERLDLGRGLGVVVGGFLAPDDPVPLAGGNDDRGLRAGRHVGGGRPSWQPEALQRARKLEPRIRFSRDNICALLLDCLRHNPVRA